MGAFFDDPEFLWAAKPLEGGLIEAQYLEVLSPDDQKGWGEHAWQKPASKVGASSARHECRDPLGALGRADKGGGGAGAGSEQSDLETLALLGLGDPSGGGIQAACEQRDVEAKVSGVSILDFLFPRKEIEEEGSEAGILQDIGHEAVSGAVSAASASVSEYDHALWRVWKEQVGFEFMGAAGDGDWGGVEVFAKCGHR